MASEIAGAGEKKTAGRACFLARAQLSFFGFSLELAFPIPPGVGSVVKLHKLRSWIYHLLVVWFVDISYIFYISVALFWKWE